MPGARILREEFALNLLEWASGEWPMQFDDEPDGRKAEQRRTALVRALRERGIEDPAATLKAVKLQAMANERDHPDQSAETWRSQALAQCAPSEFLAGLYVSFDNTMNRATTTFGREAQVWVSAVALVLVADCPAGRVPSGQATVDRRGLPGEARRRGAAAHGGHRQGVPGQDVGVRSIGCRPGRGHVSRWRYLRRDAAGARSTKCKVQASAALLSAPSLDLWPDGAPGPAAPVLSLRHPLQSIGNGFDWLWNWGVHLLPAPPKLPGILLAWILVSLGAPFWYDLLKNLFKLRSLLAQKDDADRGERDAGTRPTATIEVNKGANAGASTPAAAVPAAAAAPVGTAPVPAAPPEIDGEMGDLLATGAVG